MNQTVRQLTDTHSQLAAARNILTATGKSPRQLGKESLRKVIEWLYCWGYTSATIVQALLNRTCGGYAQKLTRQGWLAATKTVSGYPVAFFTLTSSGLSEAERHASSLFRYPEIDPYRVNQQLIRHNLIAQTATINGLNTGVITHFETERMFSQAGDKFGIKRPDVVWHTNTNLRIAVEIELSAKWACDLDDFVLGIVRSLQTTKDKVPTYDRFVIISDSKAIVDRYRAAMQPEATLSLWKKNQRGRWNIEKTVKVPDWLIDKVDFQLVGE